ncbi:MULTISPECIES: GntR family transcriptional regulator [unclassified Chelatococcus]|jgi:DNA-binding GntR family transcriptional regulator|uniref:GntR family transcriptional regulator n=1 Tax=unclassified Chelatococcus TaxID=2638111 RepID=UPI001BCBC7CB|nr:MULTISPECIES: GntR family transcriptional regulator [unclassified Chelatococcus]CAH1650512.1 DNA-binding GntR family transcriptional regulator [Hyphomicrobiales bacterium]MBS7743296.1 GntR family transcriptional regulator [Chelatococcus sp. HY11]MBX3541586.1 GntR family transcriptional regulator [Chelatococcus sp.]MCO5074522.1 GntR family transcriptional regulator [Chelatococcus sp.]CAH1692705.1 DNA-binding GntR family transcriptional regulator [Hyphomicrobiales bacterium]
MHMLDRSSPFLTTAPPGPATKNAVAGQVLRHALLTCDIVPGSAFSEVEVELRYRLGRASIRGALAGLAGEGLVTPLPRQGWRAAPITGALISSLIAARRQIEPMLAKRKLSTAEISRLESLVMLDVALAGREDLQAITTARVTDRQIMDVIAIDSGVFQRKWLTEVWDHCTRVLAFLETGEDKYHPASRADLVAALRAGDASRASAELLRDIDAFEHFVGQAALKRSDFSMGAMEKRSARRVRDKSTSNATTSVPPIGTLDTPRRS